MVFRMEARFDVKDIRKLKFEIWASRCHRIDVDIDEGWLNVSTETHDGKDRIIDYCGTFPLDEDLINEIRGIVRDSGVPFWDIGECKNRSRVCADVQWELTVSTDEEEFGYEGWDAFPKGYGILSDRTTDMAVSLFDRFSFDIDILRNIYLDTDSRTNNESFSLSCDTLSTDTGGRDEVLDTVPIHLDRIKGILRDYDLQPVPDRHRPLEYGRSIIMAVTDEYHNQLVFRWGAERPAWVDEMVRRLYDAMKEAYRDWDTRVKPINPRLPRRPDQYALSGGAIEAILETIGDSGYALPIDHNEFMDVWRRVTAHREALLRRRCIGRAVDGHELESYTEADHELNQFRYGQLDMDRINQILKG